VIFEGLLMPRSSRYLFAIASVLLIAFCFFVTDTGQEILRGKISPDTSHEKIDDIFMGAGLAPYAWMLLPGIIMGGFGLLGWVIEIRKRKRNSLQNK
jgi:TRAP-type C4-dicarboxylate transport system permease small subunit